MTRKKVQVLSVGLLVVALLVVLVGWRVVSNAQVAEAKPDSRPLPVHTAVAAIKPMPVEFTAVGQVQSEHSVVIRPQVGGVLKQVFFKQGQYVHAGQRLFLIDPAPYKAALASAKAAYAIAKAEADRDAPLVAKNYVSHQAYENAVAAVTEAQAALHQAQINLSYTDIRSPINGRTGNIVVKTGNIVSPTGTASLVTINQMQPILVKYDIPQQFLPRVRKYNAAHSVEVFITNEYGRGKLDAGKLVLIDNNVNPGTGTVMLQAEVPNQDVQLWPGQSVGVTTQLTVQPHAVVVPATAVQSGQSGNFVYEVVGGRARVQAVTVDRQVDDLAVISTGLEGGERVITRVSRKTRPGMAVAADDATTAAAARPTP